MPTGRSTRLLLFFYVSFLRSLIFTCACCTHFYVFPRVWLQCFLNSFPKIIVSHIFGIVRGSATWPLPALYPGKIIPKWHYEFHAVLQILYHGNLRDHACWTGESCLRLFKRWSERITSCRNPLRFITERYSRKIALDKK